MALFCSIFSRTLIRRAVAQISGRPSLTSRVPFRLVPYLKVPYASPYFAANPLPTSISAREFRHRTLP